MVPDAQLGKRQRMLAHRGGHALSLFGDRVAYFEDDLAQQL